MNIPLQAIQWWITANAEGYPYIKLDENIKTHKNGRFLRLLGGLALVLALLSSYQLSTKGFSLSDGAMMVLGTGFFIWSRTAYQLSVDQLVMVKAILTNYAALVKFCRLKGKRLETAWDPYTDHDICHANGMKATDKGSPQNSNCSHYGWLALIELAKNESLVDKEIKFAGANLPGVAQTSPEKEKLRADFNTALQLMRKFSLVSGMDDSIKRACFKFAGVMPS